jgi:hypothetical protein
VEILFVVVIVAVLLWRAKLQDPEWGARSPDRELADPVREKALQDALGALPDGLALSVRGCEWAAETGSGTDKGTRVVLKGVSPHLTIGVGTAVDVGVGDATLDGALTLLGPPALVRATLDLAARSALLALARSTIRAGSLKVRDGELRVDVPHADTATLVRTARAAVAAASLLKAPSDVPGRLCANVQQDIVPGVRLASLQTLVREFPDDARTAAAVRAACEDRDGDVRLAAARALGGAEGREVLIALARDFHVDDAASAQAVDALRDVSLAELEAILAAARGRSRGDETQAPARPYTARACVEALARLGDSGVPLLDRAARSESEVIARAAVRSLEKIGGPAVVGPLQDAIRHQSGDVRRAAEVALGDVQARLTGSPGQVSLAAGEAGQVTLSEDVAGRVTLGRAAEPEPPAPADRRVVKQ